MFGEPPDVAAALAFDNARLLFEALRQCQGTFTPGQIREKLAELKDFPMLTGSAAFDDTGQLRRPAFVIRLGQGKAATVQQHEGK
jgi:branched-chain amino acid transport system substrate-binding protein